MHTEIFFTAGDNLHRRQPCNAAIKIVRNGRCERERMRPIKLIVIHCSATREDREFTEYDLDICHRRRGIQRDGIPFLYPQNGDIKSTRPLERIGAHPWLQQRKYRYLLRRRARLQGTSQRYPYRMAETFDAWLILTLLKDYPLPHLRHRDLSPDLNGNGEIEPEEWIKACPCFNAEKDWGKV